MSAFEFLKFTLLECFHYFESGVSWIYKKSKVSNSFSLARKTRSRKLVQKCDSIKNGCFLSNAHSAYDNVMQIQLNLLSLFHDF